MATILISQCRIPSHLPMQSNKLINSTTKVACEVDGRVPCHEKDLYNVVATYCAGGGEAALFFQLIFNTFKAGNSLA